ncbi:MAG: hypothetical protein IKN11_07655 [Bacteroidales bacterium]|nr:hypothetical protein [Bacteroidales bacterium]
MKKYIIPACLLSTLLMTTTSCQKESFTAPKNSCIEKTASRIIRYTVNGTVYRCTIDNKEEWNILMSTIFDFAHQGYTVSMVNENITFNGIESKEVVEYTTKDQKDANTWAQKKIDEGYYVTISYNQQTGIYTCTAYR